MKHPQLCPRREKEKKEKKKTCRFRHMRTKTQRKREKEMKKGKVRLPRPRQLGSLHPTHPEIKQNTIRISGNFKGQKGRMTTTGEARRHWVATGCGQKAGSADLTGWMWWARAPSSRDLDLDEPRWRTGALGSGQGLIHVDGLAHQATNKARRR